MGKRALGSIIGIGIAIFAPYAAAALGLSGIGATLFGLGLQYAVGSIFNRGAGQKGRIQDQGILVNKASNTANLPVMYGNRRVGGTRVYLQTTDVNGATSGTEYLHIVLAFASGGKLTDASNNMDGPSVTKILLNDRDAFTTSGIDSHFAGKLDIATFRGPTDQTHSVGREYSTFGITNGAGVNGTDTDFDNNKSDEWTADHRMRGVAYVYARLKFDRDKFPAAPTILVEADGIRVRDVTKIRANASDTEDNLRNHSRHDNPANCIYDYLTNSIYGKGLADSELDIESFHNASNYYDTIGLKFNGALDTADTIYNNTQALLSSANANLFFRRGKYAIGVNNKRTFDTNTFVFDESNIIGDMTISLGSKKQKYNQMKVNYFNSGNEWQANSKIVKGTPTGANEYLTKDGNIINEGTVELELTSPEQKAKNLGNFYLDFSRFSQVISFKAAHTALVLDVDDVVLVKHKTPGFDTLNSGLGKKFYVQSLVLNQDSTVDVTLTEYPTDETIFMEDSGYSDYTR